MSKVIAFVQARMASSRLPNKVLKPLNNTTVIEHLLVRLKHAKTIDNIVVLTSGNEENDPLCELLLQIGVDFFRGSEDDVLDRFVSASKVYPADLIVRITADSPFICPEIVDNLVCKYKKSTARYAFLSEQFPEGVDCEVIETSLLLELGKVSKLESEREHVTMYLFNNPAFAEMLELKNNSNDSKYRFTLDTLDDWKVIKHMAEHFAEDSLTVNYQEIKSFFDTNPSVYCLNSHVVRNEGLAISLAKEQGSNG